MFLQLKKSLYIARACLRNDPIPLATGAASRT